jgi:hypothetical protein
LTGGEEENDWIEGTHRPGSVEESTGNKNDNGKKRGKDDPYITKKGKPDEDGDSAVDPVGGKGKVSKPRGGFNVEYKNLGEDKDRSVYDSTNLTILINLDHPVIKNAISNGGVEDIQFKRLSYEIAFSEYAIGLGYSLISQDTDMPADDLLYEVRSTLNRVTRRAAFLYA